MLKLGFTPSKGEQPLRDIKFQEKGEEKDEKNI